jgi:hypothetical protein
VRARNEARLTKNPNAATGGASQAEKIGYVPRSKATPVASGLTSASMTRNKSPDQQLDAESQAGMDRYKAKDADIDAGLDVVANQIDNLTNIASTMKSEVCSNLKLVGVAFDVDGICLAGCCSRCKDRETRKRDAAGHREADRSYRSSEEVGAVNIMRP